MNVVFFGFPARSHTIPSLPLVRELTRRGVDVEYYSTEAFRDLIASAGARFAAYPALCETLADPTDIDEHVQRLIAVSRVILPELSARLDPRTKLTIFDASALWGRTLARLIGAPAIASITTFAFTRSMLQLLGISNRDSLEVLIPEADLKIVYTSRFFQPGGRFFDDGHLFVSRQIDRPPRVGPPIAYVSLGTIFNRNIDLLKRIAGHLSQAGWQVLISLGDARRPVPGGWPSNAQVYPFVDQTAALAQAGLAVTHGGMGSVSEALACGVPLIVVPQGVDQFMIARRAATLGASITVDAAAPASAWRAALTRIETERASFVASAERISESFSDTIPIAAVVDRMLDLMLKKDSYAVCA
jgi:UDP:flavonoid glycosyltransferase YjiC (YdhE family)